MVHLKKPNNISDLVRAIKLINFENERNVQKATVLWDLIFEEWFKLKRKFRKNIKTNVRAFHQYEAEEEIVIGLINLLHNKIFTYWLNK